MKPSRGKNHVPMDTFRTGGKGAQPHSIAFGGVFFLTSQKLFEDKKAQKVSGSP